MAAAAFPVVARWVTQHVRDAQLSVLGLLFKPVELGAHENVVFRLVGVNDAQLRLVVGREEDAGDESKAGGDA